MTNCPVCSGMRGMTTHERPLRPRAPWWHRLTGCIWQYSSDGFTRRCKCGRHQVQMNNRPWPAYWEDREMEWEGPLDV